MTYDTPKILELMSETREQKKDYILVFFRKNHHQNFDFFLKVENLENYFD